MRGEEPADPDTSENAVTELPDNFRGWMEANQDRIDRAKSLPYFIRDNEGMIKSVTLADTIHSTEDRKRGDNPPDEKGKFVTMQRQQIIAQLQELSRSNANEEAFVILTDGRVFHKKEVVVKLDS